MNRSMKQLLKIYGANISNEVKDKLLELDEKLVFSKGRHDNRVNAVHKHHILYETTKEDKHGNIVGCEKELAYGHFMFNPGTHKGIYFSERTTTNRDVMEHEIVRELYTNLNSDVVYDEDRHAMKITVENVDFIVDTINSVVAPLVYKY